MGNRIADGFFDINGSFRRRGRPYGVHGWSRTVSANGGGRQTLERLAHLVEPAAEREG